MNQYGVGGFQTPNQQSSSYYAGYARPGFLHSANQMFSPFTREPYSGNPVDNNYEYAGTIGAKPFDSAAWIGQRVAAPALAMGMASAYMSGAGRSLGHGLASGAARGLGMGALSGGAGAVGGFVGSIGLPILAGLEAAELLNQSIFQPYVHTRQMAEAINRNFRGVTFGDAMGNSMSGRGLSFGESHRLGVGVNRQGWRDMTFSNSEFRDVTSMGMRAGLFDDVQSNQVLERVKSIASQVKLLMAISKDLTTQGAVEELARLRLGGASVAGGVFSQAARSYSAIGMSASAAGISTSAMMARGGAMGAGVFQNNGMTPYLGAMAGSTALAGFAVAERLGIMSTAHLARLGGVDGAAQMSLAGQVGAGNSAYNTVRMYNQFMGGGARGTVTGNMTAFAQASSRDPLSAAGNMILHRTAMLSSQAQLEGSGAVERQALELLRNSHYKGSGAGGRFTAAQLAPVLRSIGMADSEIEAYISQRASETDPRAVASRLRSSSAQTKEQLMALASQEMLYPSMAGRAGRWFHEQTNTAGEGLAGVFAYPIAGLAAEASDAAQRLNHWFMGDVTGGASHGIKIDETAMAKANRKAGKSASLPMYESALYKELNKAAMLDGSKGDLARDLIKSRGKGKDFRSNLAKFAQGSADPLIARLYEEMTKSDSVASRIAGNMGVQGAVTGDTSPMEVATTLGQIIQMGNKTSYESLQVIGQAEAFLAASDQMGGIHRDNMGILSGDGFGALNSITAGMDSTTKLHYIQHLSERGRTAGFYGSARAVTDGLISNNDQLFGMTKGTGRLGTAWTGQNVKETEGLVRSRLEAEYQDIRKTITSSSSEIDFSSYIQATKRIEDAGEKMFKAGLMMLEAQGGLPSGTAQTALGGDSTKKEDQPSSWSSSFNRALRNWGN